MGLFYPTFPQQRLPKMFALAAVGAIIAGAYGALHDQISYCISPEYFTRMKFAQFKWADVGLPPRLFASEVGVLGTWWAGLFAGWFLARAGLDEFPAPTRRRVALRAFAIVLGVACACGAIGALIGYIVSHGELRDWQAWREQLALQNLPGFVIVAWLHAGGYVGALLGLLAAMIYVRRCRQSG